MFYTPLTLLTLILLHAHTLTAQGPPTLPTFSAKVICETTSGSPKISDIESIVYVLENHLSQVKRCEPDGVSESDCSELQTTGSAKLSFCHNGVSGVTATCISVARGVRIIIEQCAWNGLAGGRYIFPGASVEINVAHT